MARWLALLLLVALPLAGCPAPAPPQQPPEERGPAPLPPPEPEAVEPTEAAPLPLPACLAERRWVRFVSSDPPLKFLAPVLDPGLERRNTMKRRGGDWDGVIYYGGGGCRIGKWDWAGERFGGTTLDYSEGIERQLHDNHSWFWRDGSVYVVQGGSKRLEYRVRPLAFVSVGRARAVLFRADSIRPLFLEGSPSNYDDELVAVINFPRDYDDDFASLTIHLSGRATIDQLRRSVRSLELTK